jgi:hypothetical protein
MDDGSAPPPGQGSVVAALASEAGSSATTERLRVSAARGARRHAQPRSSG